MPVEIKELIIRATVQSAAPGPRTAAVADPAAVALSSEERAAIVAAAVKETLRLLRQAKER